MLKKKFVLFITTLVLLYLSETSQYKSNSVDNIIISNSYNSIIKTNTVISVNLIPLAEIAIIPIIKIKDTNTSIISSYARSRVSNDNWQCLQALWGLESNWQAGRLNKTSLAVGIPQAYPPTKIYSDFYTMEKINKKGNLYLANPDYKKEIDWGLNYINNRYGNACNAITVWKSRTPHWY